MVGVRRIIELHVLDVQKGILPQQSNDLFEKADPPYDRQNGSCCDYITAGSPNSGR